MASYATLGDVIIAEPKALIGFAGRRVIKETTRADLPDGFQTSEFLLHRGLIDQIVHRHELRDKLITLIGHLGHALHTAQPAPKPAAPKKAPVRPAAKKKPTPARKKATTARKKPPAKK
jgi:acetyl-CoA carboxylase beta subunit